MNSNHSKADKKEPVGAKPPTTAEFAEINRFWDPKHETWSAKIIPGEYYTSTANELISTVLGSCVAACIRNPRTGIGGMNHFMLPKPTSQPKDADFPDAGSRYGSVAMERLINSILEYGGLRSHLEVKLFGGAKVLNIETPIGARNIEFVLKYVKSEGVNVKAVDLGGGYARKVLFYPKTGVVRIRKLTLRNATVQQRENEYELIVNNTAVVGSVTIFEDED